MKTMTKDDIWFKELSAKEQDEKIREIGKKLFSTPEGAIWLGVLLDDLYYTRIAVTEREVGLKNYATSLLKHRLGLTTDGLAVVTALLNIDTKDTK